MAAQFAVSLRRSAGLTLAAITILMVVLAAPVGAQSGGCPGGPFPGATATDSDGDGVSDADELAAGTDECDPTSVISTPLPNPPTLALTGPSAAMLSAVVGLALVVVGFAFLSVGERRKT